MRVLRLRSQKDILALMEELSAMHPILILHEIYEAAISDEDHSFWHLTLVAKKKEDMLRLE